VEDPCLGICITTLTPTTLFTKGINLFGPDQIITVCLLAVFFVNEDGMARANDKPAVPEMELVARALTMFDLGSTFFMHPVALLRSTNAQLGPPFRTA
jgi:hypothetical protein